MSAGLSDRLDFTLPGEATNEAVEYLARTGEAVTFDKLAINNDMEKGFSAFSFVRNGNVVLGFGSFKIFFNKPAGKTVG